MNLSTDISENAASLAFGRQSGTFDEIYGNDKAIIYKRGRVREHIGEFVAANASILELNSGTGEDAIYFAKQGHTVHATDISEEMQDILREKAEREGLMTKITTEKCSFTELELLQNQGPYDFVFSNFAGLNCTPRLEKVLDSIFYLLKPGGHATLVLLPKFCIWESLLLFKGKFRTAFRRFAGRKGARAHIDGQYFRCWYYNPGQIRKHLRGSFDVVKLEGLCTLVPPSYIQNFEIRHPRIYKFLAKMESKWKASWPWSVIGDYYIITLKKR